MEKRVVKSIKFRLKSEFYHRVAVKHSNPQGPMPPTYICILLQQSYRSSSLNSKNKITVNYNFNDIINKQKH